MLNFISKIITEYNIKENRTSWFLLLVSFLFVLFRIPSLIEPHWYGDEGIYQVVGRVIRDGGILYKDIWDNKPPFLYLIYAIFNGELYYVKLASLFVGLFSIFSFYILSCFLFKKIAGRYLSTFVYSLLFALPILEGNIANAENFMLFPIILSAVFVFKFLETDKNKYLYLAGFLLSIAFITKIVAVFDFLSFLTFLIIVKHDNLKILRIKFRKVKPYFLFSLSFGSLMIMFFFNFLLAGALGDFLSGVFSENVNYVNVKNDYGFPLGILFLKSIFIILAVLFIFKKIKKLSKNEIFVYLWFAFSLYNAFFSHRPYVHYLLVILPAFSLLAGILVEKNTKRILNTGLIFLAIFVAIYHFTIYKKTYSYYLNYIDFLTNNKSVREYYEFFDKRTPFDYEIANFINESTVDTETVFLWSNSAQIYALTNKVPVGKYAVAYHITFYKGADSKTIEAIEIQDPRFIIQTAEEPMPYGLLAGYKFKYEIDGAKIYEREI